MKINGTLVQNMKFQLQDKKKENLIGNFLFEFKNTYELEHFIEILQEQLEILRMEEE